MKRLFTYGLAILGLFISASEVRAQDVTITASAPRVVRVGEQFRLNYVVNAIPSFFDAPDLTDFYVLSGPNQSTSRNFQIINGKSTSSVTITYTYFVQATGEGEYTIDPAGVTVDNKEYVSNAVNINVIKGEDSAPPDRQGTETTEQPVDVDVTDELFVRLHTDRKTIFQGEYIIATIKLYTRLQIAGFGESKMPDYASFWTQDIEAPTQLNMVRENVNGSIFNTGVIRKVILFPQKTGEITISPFSLETYVRQLDQRRRSPFDDFFGPSYQNVLKKLETKPVSITVKPLPGGAPSDFHGAVGKIRLSAEIDKQEVETNDAVNYKIVISGSGNIELTEAPVVKFPPDFESYDPKVQTSIKNTVSGQTGSKTFEYLLIPRHAGNFRIPPVSLSYFDTGSKSYKTLSTGEFNLSVLKGEGEETVSLVTGRSKEDLRIIGSDILFIKDHSFKLRRIGDSLFGSALFFMLYAISLFLFLAILLIRRNQIKKQQNVELLKNQRASREARKRLREASAYLKKGDAGAFYEAVLRALEGYLVDKLSIPYADLSKVTAREGLQKYHVPMELIDEYIALADQCEYAKYSPGSEEGGMEELYERTIRAISKLEQKLRG